MSSKKSKAEAKTGLIKKVKALVKATVAGKKATPKRAIKNVKAKPRKTAAPAPDTETVQADPAHSPGHRRLNIKAQKGKAEKIATQNDSAMNNMARNDRIARNATNKRRVMSR